MSFYRSQIGREVETRTGARAGPGGEGLLQIWYTAEEGAQGVHLCLATVSWLQNGRARFAAGVVLVPWCRMRCDVVCASGCRSEGVCRGYGLHIYFGKGIVVCSGAVSQVQLREA